MKIVALARIGQNVWLLSITCLEIYGQWASFRNRQLPHYVSIIFRMRFQSDTAVLAKTQHSDTEYGVVVLPSQSELFQHSPVPITTSYLLSFTTVTSVAERINAVHIYTMDLYKKWTFRFQILGCLSKKKSHGRHTITPLHTTGRLWGRPCFSSSKLATDFGCFYCCNQS